MKAQISRLKSTLKQGKDFAWKDKDDVATLEFLFEKALPIAEGKFGEDNIRFHVFRCMIEEMQDKRIGKDGNASTTVQYS